MSSPTQRSLKVLRDRGFTAEVVERWNPHTRTRHDLFGFVDILAISHNLTLAVQTTDGSSVAARIKKIADHPNLPHVRAAGWAIHVHGWRKNSKGRWELREVDVS